MNADMSRTQAIRELFRRAADDPSLGPLVWKYREPDRNKLDLRAKPVLAWRREAQS